jgi:hypothetical protein
MGRKGWGQQNKASYAVKAVDWDCAGLYASRIICMENLEVRTLTHFGSQQHLEKL